MMAAAPPKATKETWLDLMPEGFPEPPLLSRDELLDELQDRDIELTSSALQYYRHRGLLPRPIRRRHGGVTQAVYPLWFVDVIAYLKRQQNAGKSLDEIQPRMRDWIRALVLNTVQWRDADLDASTTALDVALREYAKATQPWIADLGAINSIRVALLDADGNELNYHDIPYTP